MHSWQVGDKLRGECRCDSSKIIDFEYLGGTEFLECGRVLPQKYFNMKPTSTLREILNVLWIPNNSDYTNWRHVPGYNSFWTKKREDAVNLHSSSPRTPVDYEFGDTIKVRGFEYVIKHYSGSSTQGIYLEKKEPPKCSTCGRS